MDTDELLTEVTITLPEKNNDDSSTNSVEILVDENANSTENTDAGGTGESDAVEIARIQSQRDVTIAALNAETEQTREATHLQQLENERIGIDKCLEEIAALRAKVETMEANLLTPQEPLAEAIAEVITEELPTETGQNLTLPSTSIPMPEIVTEVSESVEEEKETEQENPKRRFTAI